MEILASPLLSHFRALALSHCGSGRAPPLRSGSGCARRRQRYNCCQRRRAPCAEGHGTAVPCCYGFSALRARIPHAEGHTIPQASARGRHPPLPASPPQTARGRGDVPRGRRRDFLRACPAAARPLAVPLLARRTSPALAPTRGASARTTLRLRPAPPVPCAALRVRHRPPPAPPLPRSWGRGRPPREERANRRAGERAPAGAHHHQPSQPANGVDPPPAPPRSFLAERGELRSRSRRPERVWACLTTPPPKLGRGRPPREERAKSAVGGEGSRRSVPPSALAAGPTAWAPPPAPPRSFLAERGETSLALPTSGARLGLPHHPSPEVGGGVDRLARNERTGGRGRGLPPERATISPRTHDAVRGRAARAG
jgi:hypothetical protein